MFIIYARTWYIFHIKYTEIQSMANHIKNYFIKVSNIYIYKNP